MTTATKITLVRLFLIPIFVLFVYLNFRYSNLIAALIYFVACVSDVIDGIVARKHNQISDNGAFLDALVDKLLILAALAIIIDKNVIPSPINVIVALLLISRDIMMQGFRGMAGKKGIVIPADKLGKAKTLFQMVGTVALMLTLDEILIKAYSFFYWLGLISLLLSVVFSIVSLIHYIWKYKEVLK